MLDFGNADAEICIIGRTNFHSGIGSISYATAELLARSFPVSFLPTEKHWDPKADEVTLPNGRVIPVCRDPSRVRASIFCDVLWNGQADFNYAMAPPGSLKYAWFVYDSDRLPRRWVELLNGHFDLVLATSPHLVPVARANGVETPIACMPIPLDLDGPLAEPLPSRRLSRTVRFGSVAAFHPRKGVETLVEAFTDLYAGRDDVELVLHSNLAIGPTFETIRTLAKGHRNIRIRHRSLSTAEKNQLIRSFDIFVNCSRGEGYSIGPREALAYGRGLVLSDVGGHKDLAGLPGVFMVPTSMEMPARYPELDNLVHGTQHAVSVADARSALAAAYDFATSAEYDRTSVTRRRFAKELAFSAMAPEIAGVIDPSIPRFRPATRPTHHVSVPADFSAAVERRLGRRADSIGGTRRQVCAAYDAGFFSIFNAFMSHLVWQQAEQRCHSVLPDWDVDRLIERLGDAPVTSFCYGREGDGNLWARFFEPLFGASQAEMNDADFLWRHAEQPEARHNEVREPLMTYIHAYRLYQDAEFRRWRRQYHRVFTEHVRLLPAQEAEIAAFAAAHLGRRFLVAAHVRHPSHTVEQPTGKIAHTEAYIEAIYDQVAKRGIARDSEDWGVFLATDQDRVTRRFRAEFGDRVAFFTDVRRTRDAEDAAFDALSPEERNRDGHQLQHLVAADRSQWSARMAWEVIRDAWCMARCHCLLHVVSNVSTAVAYMNPELEMIFCRP
jgi:glycosyltransferase involved in cell wall biosynthesis